MATLLVLGSKPEPVLPPHEGFDALACANASGRSAARHDLPMPTFTVMSAILTSGKQAPNRLALTALRGLGTGTLYFYPRPARGRNVARRLLEQLRSFRVGSFHFKRQLKALSYRFDRFADPGLAYYQAMLADLCDRDPALLARMRAKQPSSGMLALALGMAEHAYDRFILSGFSFEITHAYADNPLIAERGSTASQHADTDIALLRHLSKKFGNIYTTEPVVSERTGVPLLTDFGRSTGTARSAG
jgi:hypothetical protein